MSAKQELLDQAERIGTTPGGVQRIVKNLGTQFPELLGSMELEQIEDWCRKKMVSPQAEVTRRGKNWYVAVDGCVFTVNAFSGTVITAHRQTKQ